MTDRAVPPGTKRRPGTGSVYRHGRTWWYDFTTTRGERVRAHGGASRAAAEKALRQRLDLEREAEMKKAKQASIALPSPHEADTPDTSSPDAVAVMQAATAGPPRVCANCRGRGHLDNVRHPKGEACHGQHTVQCHDCLGIGMVRGLSVKDMYGREVVGPPVTCPTCIGRGRLRCPVCQCSACRGKGVA